MTSMSLNTSRKRYTFYWLPDDFNHVQATYHTLRWRCETIIIIKSEKNKHEPLGPIIRTLANMNIVQKQSYYKPQLVYERGFAVILFKTFPLSSKGHTLFPESKHEDPILT